MLPEHFGFIKCCKTHQVPRTHEVPNFQLISLSSYRTRAWQVVNLHYILSKARVASRPSVLWCYKKEVGGAAAVYFTCFAGALL